MRLSIIIPTWNEARYLGRTLDSLQGVEAEILCVDGGSRDDTMGLAHSFGVNVLSSPRGRGMQLMRGAHAASGDILWFLHADTVVRGDAVTQIRDACARPGVAGGNFRLHFDGDSRPARFLEWLYPHLAHFGLQYGDSGIFATRSAYRACGGMYPLPLFEDVDFLKRLRRVGMIRTLPGPLVTSSRRFSGRRFSPVLLKWSLLQVLYWLGCNPVLLASLYYRRSQSSRG